MRPRDPVPDLLKRFVETPFRWVGDYIVESNDLSFIEQLGEQYLRIPPGFRLRVVREDSAVSCAGSNTIMCTSTICVIATCATLALIDRLQKSAFAFLSYEVSTEQFIRETLLVAFDHLRSHDV